MVGTVLLNNPKYNSTASLSNNTDYTISLLTNTEPETINTEYTVENNTEIEETKDNDIKEETKEISNTNTSENKKETQNSTTSTINKTSTTTTNTNTKTESSTIKVTDNTTSNTETVKNDLTKEETVENETKEEIVDNNTYVTIYRQNGTVLTLELEEYLVGVVAGEMPASFNIEALKAQAIIARTYTMKAINTGKKLTDTTSTQVYKSSSELKNTWGSNYNTYYNKIKNAVDSTKGLVLTYNGTLIEAVYHSTSNGKTENSENVWTNSFPYLVSVDSPYDTTNKSFSTTTFFSYETLSNKLNTTINEETEFLITLNESGRVKTIEFNNLTLTGVEFRTKLSLRSADFVLEKTNDGINITTEGYGHGVGMSQYGANGMANNGSNYETILKHYYKGVTITYKL